MFAKTKITLTVSFLSGGQSLWGVRFHKPFLCRLHNIYGKAQQEIWVVCVETTGSTGDSIFKHNRRSMQLFYFTSGIPLVLIRDIKSLPVTHCYFNHIVQIQLTPAFHFVCVRGTEQCPSYSGRIAGLVDGRQLISESTLARFKQLVWLVDD